MILPPECTLLRIFIGESDRHEGAPLYEWLVIRAKEAGLAGATVLRGMMGFGAGSRIHTSKILRLSMDLPIVVECVDTEERISGFLSTVETAFQGGMITLEKVRIHTYRGGTK